MKFTAPVKLIFTNPIHFISFGFGSGLLPKAPGTYGTIAAIPFVLLMQYTPWYVYLLILIGVFAASIFMCDITAKALGVEDHPGIVLDEIVGLMVTMFLIPTGFYWLLAGFILFRIFDIWKPWPIKIIEKTFMGGLGIVMDDVVAGIYAWLVLQVFIRFM